MRARRDSQNTDQIKEKAARASLHLDSGGYGEREGKCGSGEMKRK
jgi:hypothetical protein